MRLTLLFKDDKSGVQGCPSVYLSDSGELVVQGQQLDGPDMSELQNLLPNEAAVRISPDIVLRAIERYRQGGAQ
ncbi:hypothetical protein GCM10009799_02830 [Nocardiopsis rhodophaea]|uniref:Uncharacterized protein n=1 Tax=Nocardiopsis rhodophaea TaxID=280238 RepID=A0ABN1K188_9ACTN